MKYPGYFWQSHSSRSGFNPVRSTFTASGSQLQLIVYSVRVCLRLIGVTRGSVSFNIQLIDQLGGHTSSNGQGLRYWRNLILKSALLMQMTKCTWNRLATKTWRDLELLRCQNINCVTVRSQAAKTWWHLITVSLVSKMHSVQCCHLKLSGILWEYVLYWKLFGVLKKKTHIPCTVSNKPWRLEKAKVKQIVLFC